MAGDKPPKLKEGSEFLQWKREIEMWRLATTLKEPKQAPLVILSILDRKARDFATRLEKEKLVCEDGSGLTYLLTELSKYFAKDRVQSVFLAIEHLESFVRPKEMQMGEFISEFGRRVDAVAEIISTETEEKKPYDDGVLAYRLLKQDNLTNFRHRHS